MVRDQIVIPDPIRFRLVASSQLLSACLSRKKELRVPAIIATRAATRLEPSSRNNKHPILKQWLIQGAVAAVHNALEARAPTFD
ncbi:hypothetical protein DFH06DRAFT_1330254 [Mycena polygramma]|nr:hypothetical protein DFH06DRAFT_1330254 [Mycena polygramma]